MAPLQIRSEALRRPRLSAAADPMRGFGLPDAAATEPNPSDGKRTAWRQADLSRAIKAAEKAELSSYRIEIAPDGTISIVVGASAETQKPSIHG